MWFAKRNCFYENQRVFSVACFSRISLLFWTSFAAAAVQVQQQQKQQHFLLRPKDTVAVEGGIADLHCQIGSLAGNVQWSKDGFLLGFDPAIPGYARYSMLVDTARGIYNLRIHNVQTDDEAEYQCQVGPAPNNLAIRAQAKVSVIVPPKNLEIAGHKNGSTLQMKEGQKMSLLCTAKKSKPSTKLKWTRNGVEITKDLSPMREDVTHTGLKTTSLSFTLSPKLDDNNVVYSCLAEHPAIGKTLKTSVFLSVQYPPQPPEIEGYHDGDIVQVGDKLSLACMSRGGNPPAKLIWYKGDDVVDETYSTGGREATNTFMFVVGPNDNKAIYRCEASNSVTLQPLVASVRLNVLFPPSRVTITGPKESRAGESVTLNCQTGSSNPPVEVSWVVDGRPMMSTQAVTEEATGGWVTSSNVTVSVSRQDPDTKTFSCYAVSEALGETIVQTASLSVVYPCNAPNILGHDEKTSLKSGEIQKYTCVATGGNPHATLRWFKNDKEIRGVEKSTTTGSSNELAIRAEASDNGAVYRCEASNSAMKQPLVATVVPRVLFPATSVSIRVKPRKPKAGDFIALVCETGSSNPESTVLWWKDGESISGNHEGVADSTYGGKSTRNKVRMNVTASDDGSTYTCQATNHALRRTAHDTFVLRVLYKPEFQIGAAERFDVLEGDSISVNATAKGNPPQITYSWTRNGLPILDVTDGNSRTAASRYGHRAVYRGPILELKEVYREDGGEYGCEAANTEGVTWTSVSINVLFPAKITKLPKSIVVGSGDNAEFECQALANPFVNRLITWRRHSFDMSRTHETVGKGTSTLIVFNVSRSDAGEFECIADNGIGTETIQTTRLIVKFKPLARLPQSFLDVAGEEGESARLVCLAEGAPEVTFVWSYNGGILSDNFSSSKYASQAAQLDDMTWESVLFVKHLQANDFGYYTCVARNDLGHDHVKVKLRRRGRPDPPYSVRIVNSSSDSVVISWTPGYSSGLPQQFRIRYQPAGTEEYKFADVFPSNTTVFSLTGLQPATEYHIRLSARNALGESDNSKENTRAFTMKRKANNQEVFGATQDAFSGDGGEMPKLLLAVVSVVGSFLLALNVILVVCFIRRRKRQRHVQGTEKAEPQTTSPDSLMYTPSKYQQSINGEAICRTGGVLRKGTSHEEEILMKELIETKKLVMEEKIAEYIDPGPYDISRSREKDNCPDLLINRVMDHVGLHPFAQLNTVPLPENVGLGAGIDVIEEVDEEEVEEQEYRTRYDPRLRNYAEERLEVDVTSPGSCVVGTMGSHLV